MKKIIVLATLLVSISSFGKTYTSLYENPLFNVANSNKDTCVLKITTYANTRLEYTCDKYKKLKKIATYDKDVAGGEQVAIMALSAMKNSYKLLSHTTTAQKHGVDGKYIQTLVFSKNK
jgi:hypothetical protein